jgi:cytosine deaminase
MNDADYMELALEEARQGLAEGGIPIGSVLVIGDEVIGRGHNQRQQKGSAVLHAEMDALEKAGRLNARRYRQATLYTTLSPCAMCTGAVLLYRIPRVVIGENRSFMGEEALLTSRGVSVTVLDHPGCRKLMETFISENPDFWAEDIGEYSNQTGNPHS